MKTEKQIIVVKEKRSGCGSMLLVIFLAFICIGAYIAMQKPEPSRPAASSGPLLPGDQPLDQSFVDLKITTALRTKLNLWDRKSYQAVDTKYSRCRGGWLYVHRYRAKNAVGAMVPGMFGLLHEADGKWTFYSESELPSLTDEIKKNL